MESTEPVIVRFEYGSQAWWDLIHAVQEATRETQTGGVIYRDISISVDHTMRGETVTAVKVAEGLWSAHRPIVRR